MKRRIIFLIYGFVLISVWSICFVGYKQSDDYTSAMGLSFTFLSIYFLQKEYDFKLSLSDKLFVIAFPVLYLISWYFIIFNTYFTNFKYSLYFKLFYIHIINPLNIALLVLLLGLTKMKDLSKLSNLFIFIYITLFYAYFFHSAWRGFQFASLTKNFDTEKIIEPETQKAKEPDLNYTVNLSDFSFINSDLDTLSSLNSSEKYILLETWNETCFPCIKAMKELPDFYRSIQNKAEVYYLYENSKEHVRRKFEDIFNFKNIEDKSKILIDINQDLYKELNMNGFPYFLLFDSKGNLIFHSRGYMGKEALSKQILEHLQ